MLRLSVTVALISVFVSACTSPNNVERVEQAESIIKYRQQADETDRFENLYPGKKSYPVTCTDECYPNSALLRCDSPAESCEFTGQQARPNISTGFNIQWLGHASFRINSPDGSTLLIDPVSEQFDWPVNWAFRLSAGFNRNEPKWPNPSEIETTDAVLYSHIHYDHFNKDDINRIGSNAHFFVPLGFAQHFPTNGFTIHEMAWFSQKSLGELTLNFVPAHHFSSRILVPYLYEDNDKTLWGGWVIEHQNKKLFFAGDTGYSKHFIDINKRYGDMDICLIPIASYYHKENSNWYRYVHTTPEDALTAAKELNCKIMIPWGYGNASWKMGDHSSHSALLRLLHMHKKMKSSVPLHILNEGEMLKL